FRTSPSSPAVGTRPGYRTSRPPCSNAPQISKVDASNVTGASCRNTSSGPNSAYPGPKRSLITPRCVTSTPFGSPVDPDVYVTYARSSRTTPPPGVPSDSFPISLHPESRYTTSLPDNTPSPSTPLSLSWVSRTSTSASLTRNSRRSFGYEGSRGTYPAPAFTIPSSPTTSSSD